MDGPTEWLVAASCERGLEEAPDALVTADDRHAVLFDGVLYEREGLERRLALPPLAARSDGERVLAAYRRWGDATPEHLNGTFTIVAWNSAEHTLQAVRDPLGIQPLFRCERGGVVFLSNSLAMLTHDPRVPSEVSRIALAARIARRMPFQEETPYAYVQRVPQGHAWSRTPRGARLRRYWAPWHEEVGAHPVTPEEADAALDLAVARRLRGESTGIYLSGGLDSVAVAAYAAHRERVNGRTPLALSLVVPGEESVPGEAQRSAARALELPQILVSLEGEAGDEGPLAQALALAAEWPAPLLNPWLPGFLRLNAQAVERGYRTLLTGGGGDEWLTTPYIAADLLRTLRLGGLASFLAAHRRAYGGSLLHLARHVLWPYGLRPLLTDSVRPVLERRAKPLLRARLEHIVPAWLAPDPGLRRELLDRPTALPSAGGSIYARAARRIYDHALQDADMEELYEAGRRYGIRLAHPFLDLDLLALRYRARPEELNRGGRPKGIVREAVERRFRPLTAEQHPRPTGSDLFTDMLRRDGPRLFDAAGTAKLAGLGVVDPSILRAVLNRGTGEGSASQIWDALVLAAWLKQIRGAG